MPLTFFNADFHIMKKRLPETDNRFYIMKE